MGEQALFLVDFEEIEEKYGDCTVRTLSPVTIHSTFELPGGSKKTYYYAPTEKEFSMQLRDNIIRKYISIYGAEPDDDDLEIIPLNVQKMKKVVINYKSTVIVGWTGSFAIHGNPELIRIALLCGFGARNGMGMGAVIQKPIIR